MRPHVPERASNAKSEKSTPANRTGYVWWSKAETDLIWRIKSMNWLRCIECELLSDYIDKCDGPIWQCLFLGEAQFLLDKQIVPNQRDNSFANKPHCLGLGVSFDKGRRGLWWNETLIPTEQHTKRFFTSEFTIKKDKKCCQLLFLKTFCGNQSFVVKPRYFRANVSKLMVENAKPNFPGSVHGMASKPQLALTFISSLAIPKPKATSFHTGGTWGIVLRS